MLTRARGTAAVIALAAIAAAAQPSAAQSTGLRAPPAPGMAAIAGAVDDSLRRGALVGATVSVIGTNRSAITDQAGLFRIDSILPGTVQLRVQHPLLDSLLIVVSTAPFATMADRLDEIALATPSLARVKTNLCPRGGFRSGEAMLAGRVDDAELGVPLPDALVSLVYVDPATGVGNERLRSARTDADGLYAICGLPETFDGTVQASVGGNASAEVPLSLAGQLFETAGFVIGSASRSDSGNTGSAVLMGRIIDVAGRPLSQAQVTIEGGNGVALTSDDGAFRLDGLPSGTTIASVRKIGFAPAIRTVHLRNSRPESMNVTMPAMTRTLAPVTITAKRDEMLDRLGFTDRLRIGNRSNFMLPEEIEKRENDRLTDLFRTIPGFIITRQGQRQTLESSRAVNGGQRGCVNVFVDRMEYQQLDAGDLDAVFPVGTVGAIESYPSVASTPSEFLRPGRNCATVVIWTRLRINRP